MNDLIWQYPQCPHLIEGEGTHKNCAIIADLTGGIYEPMTVNPLFCQITCNRFGPYCDKKISKEKLIKFVADKFILEFGNEYRNKLLPRVMTHFSNPITVVYPELQWNEIKKRLQPFIDNKEIKKIYLTGSLFLKQNNFKDFDILLEIDDWNKVKEIKNKLPKTILNTPCEYFFSRNPKEGRLFTTFLDMEDKTLYVSSWYILIIIDKPQDLKVIAFPNDEVSNYILTQSDKSLSSILKHSPCKKCPQNESK